jgi:hypothetical protein
MIPFVNEENSAQQTNIVDVQSAAIGDFISGDEVVHENDLQKIEEAAKKNLKDFSVEGLLFSWYHFFGNMIISQNRGRSIFF